MRTIQPLAALAALAAVPAFAIPIANPGFEDLLLRDDSSFNHSIPSWDHPSDGRSGTINPGVSLFPDSAVPEGSNAAYAARGGLFQQLAAVVQPGIAYVLSVQVGRDTDVPGEFSGYVVELRVGGQAVAWDHNGLALAPGSWAPVQLSFAVGALDPRVGQPLSIYLGNLERPTYYYTNAYFDAVTLEAQPVPEPAAGALAAAGLLAVAAQLRRRARRVSQPRAPRPASSIAPVVDSGTAAT